MADKDNRQSGFDRTVYPTNIDEDVPISYDYTETQEVIYLGFITKILIMIRRLYCLSMLD